MTKLHILITGKKGRLKVNIMLQQGNKSIFIKYNFVPYFI